MIQILSNGFVSNGFMLMMPLFRAALLLKTKQSISMLAFKVAGYNL